MDVICQPGGIYSVSLAHCLIGPDDASLLIIDVGGSMQSLRTGDTFTFFNLTTLERLGSANMVSATRVTDKDTLTECYQVDTLLAHPLT